MTGREKKLLAMGIVGGLFLGALLLFFLGERLRDREHAQHVQPMGSQIELAPTSAPAGGTQRAAEPAPSQPGAVTGTLQLSSDEQRAIGVRTTEVRMRRLQRDIATVGRVEEAETRLATISARVGGRLDKLFLNFTGQPVERGQRVALIYSPELVSALEEYKLARHARQQLGRAAHEQALVGADELVAASRRRLELWGLEPEQIEELAGQAEPQIHVPIHATTAGIVTERRVSEGQYVREGDVLYTLADLSTVWVLAEVYEPDVPALSTGQAVEITSGSLPGATLRGRVSFIEPQVTRESRTVPVRIEVRNPGMRLRPGMFVNANIKVPVRETLAVPRSAVLRAGARDVVYVAKGDGVFEGREVSLGPPAEDFVPVLAGLEAGERVVTEGNFLIDSQTRIATGATGMFGGLLQVNDERPAPETRAAPGQYTVTFHTQPDPPRGAADNRFLVTVTGPDGKPVTDARVRVTLVMPAMPAMNMPEMRSTAELRWDGSQYSGTGNVSMGGGWNVSVEVRRADELLATHRTQIMAR